MRLLHSTGQITGLPHLNDHSDSGDPIFDMQTLAIAQRYDHHPKARMNRMQTNKSRSQQLKKKKTIRQPFAPHR
jgi:hypothetical protein